MNLGRSHIAALCLCCIAVAVSGCGDDSSSKTPTADSAGATADSGSTGATGTEKKKSSKSAKKSDSNKSSSGKADKRVTAYNNPTVETVAPDELVPPPEQKSAVREAFNKNIDAIRNGDVSYLCDTAYSRDFVAMLEQKGGCETATAKQIDGITSYSAKVTAISRFPNSNLIAVYANFKFTNASGAHKSKGGLYYKTEDSSWKRAVPPKA